MTFDPDDYELRWPPQLFIDEIHRLVSGLDRWSRGVLLDSRAVEWLLTEAFNSTIPAAEFRHAIGVDRISEGEQVSETARPWLLDLVQEAARWPEPGTKKPYWSARMRRQDEQRRLDIRAFFHRYIEIVEGLETDGYFARAFGQECVDEKARPNPMGVLSRRLGYSVAWPLEVSKLGPAPDLDEVCDMVEVLHDVVARPSTRIYHDFNQCGWHYSDFVTRPARRLYRWRVNRLLADSDLGLRLAEEGEDLGRLVRVEPTGLEDLPDKAMQSATPESVGRVQHAIALFRSRNATVEERRSAVITLAGILEERRNLLNKELLSKDEGALFTIANQFAIRHQRADQRSDYDDAYLYWVFWWYLGTVELTNQLLARPSAKRRVEPD